MTQFIKEHTTDQAHSELEFYLYTNDEWKYGNIIKHLKTSSATCETFNLLVDNSYVGVKGKKNPLTNSPMHYKY